MTKRTRTRSTFGVLAVAAACASAFVSAVTFGEEPAEAAPDPEAVHRYLSELEANGAVDDNAQKKAGRGESIRKMVEGAAVRAPSGSVINGIEASLAEKLG